GLVASAVVALCAIVASIHASSVPSSTTRIARIEVIFWSLLTHLVVASVAISVLNLIWMVARPFKHARSVRAVLTMLTVVAGLSFALIRFLESVFGLHGWRGTFFAGLFSASVVLLTVLVIAFAADLLRGLSLKSTARRAALAALALLLAFVLIE